jgi:hypothetical protein
MGVVDALPILEGGLSFPALKAVFNTAPTKILLIVYAKCAHSVITVWGDLDFPSATPLHIFQYALQSRKN